MSGSGVISVAPKILIWRSLSFLVTRSGRVVSRRALSINKGRGRRGCRLCRRAILDGGSLVRLKN